MVGEFYQLVGDLFKSENQIISCKIARDSVHMLCTVGISAFEWSKRNFTAILVTFRGRHFTAMIPISVADDYRKHKFFLVEAGRYVRERKAFVLLAYNEETNSEYFTWCLFPQDVKVIGWKF